MSDRDFYGATPDDQKAAPANPISLADVIALPVVPHWAEAVAVVQELCALLSATAPDSGIVPELPDVVITSGGSVMVRKGARGVMDVHELGRILYALLDPGTTPMALRLFAAHAMTSGSYATVSAYAEALTYYARPGRRELIRALYDRCLETPLESTPTPVGTSGAVLEPPTRDRRAPRWIRVVVLIAFGAAGATAAAWAWSREARVPVPVRAVRDAVASAAGTVRERLVAPLATPPAVAPITGVEPAPHATSPRRSAERDALLPHITNDVAPMGPPTVPQAQRAPALEGGLASPPTVPTPAPRVAPSVVTDESVYTAASAGVQPPVLIFPRLPPFPVVPPQASGTNTMELLIDTFGRVEHVRLVSEPVRMQDMTLLSAAKVWRYHPALKDGRPVRYRLSLSWIVSPP